jgi:hypothetical protein
MYTKDEARALLPKVGDKRKETPTWSTGKLKKIKPLDCVVVAVDPDHLWYEVEFGNGYRECYKVPETNWNPWGGALK